MRNNVMNKLALSEIMVCLIIFLGMNDLFAASTVLSWTPPTANDDGTELNDLDGYKVYYGTESGNYTESIDAGNVVTYEVSNLSAGATYYFATTAYNIAGNESQYSAEINKTFTGSDITPPVISGVQASGITDSSATVSWTTNEASDTKIQYGITTSYGTTTALDSSKVTSHSQSIGGLEASQLYHYSVISRDAAGNETVSGDYTFTTLAPPEFVHYYCDSDNDGYAGTSYDGYCIGAGCELAGCQATPGSDCNDSNPAINPLTNWYQDNDGDGFGTSTIYFQQCTQPGGPINYVLNSNDFDDNDPAIDLPIKIDGSTPFYYTALQDAYDDALDGDTIQVIAGAFTGDLYIDMDKSVTLDCGYDGAFTAITGLTTLNGDMIISEGTLARVNFILQ